MWEYIRSWDNDECIVDVNGVRYRIIYIRNLWNNKGYYKVVNLSIKSTRFTAVINKLEKEM